MQTNLETHGEDNTNKLNPIDPQKNILPKTQSNFNEIISTEANYEKWASFLFPQTKSKNIYGRRTKEWEAVMSDGKTTKSIIEVIPAQDSKGYSTRTYDVYLALVAIWRERNMPVCPMKIYLSDIARKLELSPSGVNWNNIIEELRCLEETKISWVFSFKTKDNSEETYKGQRILSTFEYTKIKERSKHSQSKCKVGFSTHIMENIKNQITIPVNFKARKSIKSESAKALYNRIDSILSKISKHEKTLTNLVGELGLTKSRYQYKSQRKVLAEVFKKNLDNLPLSLPNYYLSVEVMLTNDKLDYKCVFTKYKKGGNPTTKTKLPIVNKDKNFRNYLADLMSEKVGFRDKNLKLYHLFALHYSENHINRAIGEYKELIKNSNIANKGGYFTSIMHTTAHKLKREWINPCDANCKYRPENQLFPEA